MGILCTKCELPASYRFVVTGQMDRQTGSNFNVPPHGAGIVNEFSYVIAVSGSFIVMI